MNLKFARTALLFLKYLPVATFLWTIYYVAMLIQGVYVISGDANNCFFGFSIIGTIELIVASKAFGMCWRHRALILYCQTVSLCVYLQQIGFWGDYVIEARTCVFLTGVIQLTDFILHIHDFYRSQPTRKGIKAYCK